jgi:hypothetical protein
MGDSRPIKYSGPFLMSPGGSIPELQRQNTESSSFFEEQSDASNREPEVIPQGPSLSPGTLNRLSSTFEKRQLFGGAITMSIPKTFEDISKLRQVPDNQEVFIDMHSDMSLIVEILGYDDEVCDKNIGAHYFADLAQCNDATDSNIESNVIVEDATFIPLTPNRAAVLAVHGTQSVCKKLQENSDVTSEQVKIILIILRMPDVGTDFLVSLNYPLTPRETSGGSLTPSDDLMKSTLNTLHVEDWSLFA